MPRKKSYAELSAVINRNIKGLVTRKGLANGLVNDLAETYEDVRRLRRDLAVLAGSESERESVKKALMSICVWAWHTADHLNNIHKILEDEL